MSPIIEGHLGPYEVAGAPVQGTNEVQTLTIGGTPTGGTFKLAFDGHTSGPITWTDVDATLLANIQAALDAMSNVGTICGCSWNAYRWHRHDHAHGWW
jgi:hypothetical protein